MRPPIDSRTSLASLFEYHNVKMSLSALHLMFYDTFLWILYPFAHVYTARVGPGQRTFYIPRLPSALRPGMFL